MKAHGSYESWDQVIESANKQIDQFIIEMFNANNQFLLDQNIQSMQLQPAKNIVKLAYSVMNKQVTNEDNINAFRKIIAEINFAINLGIGNDKVKAHYKSMLSLLNHQANMLEHILVRVITRSRLLIAKQLKGDDSVKGQLSQMDIQIAKEISDYIEGLRKINKGSDLSFDQSINIVLQLENIYQKYETVQADNINQPLSLSTIESTITKEASLIQGPRQKTEITRMAEDIIFATMMNYPMNVSINLKNEIVVRLPIETLKKIAMDHYHADLAYSTQTGAQRPIMPDLNTIVTDRTINYSQVADFIDFSNLMIPESILNAYSQKINSFKHMFPTINPNNDIYALLQERKQYDTVENLADLSDIEKAAIYIYTTDRYKEINALLRSGKLPDSGSGSMVLAYDADKIDAFKEAISVIGILSVATNKKHSTGLYVANNLSDVVKDMHDDTTIKSTSNDYKTTLQKQKMSDALGVVLVRDPNQPGNAEAFFVKNKQLVMNGSKPLSVNLSLTQQEQYILMNETQYCANQSHKVSRFPKTKSHTELYRTTIDGITARALSKVPHDKNTLLESPIVRGERGGASDIMKNSILPTRALHFANKSPMEQKAMGSNTVDESVAKTFMNIAGGESLPILTKIKDARGYFNISTVSAYMREEEILTNQLSMLFHHMKEGVDKIHFEAEIVRPVQPEKEEVKFDERFVLIREILIKMSGFVSDNQDKIIIEQFINRTGLDILSQLSLDQLNKLTMDIAAISNRLSTSNDHQLVQLTNELSNLVNSQITSTHVTTATSQDQQPAQPQQFKP